MPTVQFNVYISDEDYTKYIENKSKIQKELKQVVNEWVKGDQENEETYNY